MEKREFLSNVILPLLLDKLLAINAFFLIWIVIGYARWRFYLMFSDVEIARWVGNTLNVEKCTELGLG